MFPSFGEPLCLKLAAAIICCVLRCIFMRNKLHIIGLGVGFGSVVVN